MDHNNLTQNTILIMQQQDICVGSIGGIVSSGFGHGRFCGGSLAMLVVLIDLAAAACLTRRIWAVVAKTDLAEGCRSFLDDLAMVDLAEWN